MKIIYFFVAFMVTILLNSCNSTTVDKNDSSSPMNRKLPIVIIGPSTVYIEKYPDNQNPSRHYSDDSACRLYGWGELLPELLKDSNSSYNFAQPGSTAQTL